jgi:hypothetical protein
MNEQRELFIFPTRDKRPLTARGFHDAQPESHWSGEEAEQWGAPTGAVNGFFVVDVDAKKNGLETAASIDWGNGHIVQTPGEGFMSFTNMMRRRVRRLRMALIYCQELMLGLMAATLSSMLESMHRFSPHHPKGYLIYYALRRKNRFFLRYAKRTERRWRKSRKADGTPT